MGMVRIWHFKTGSSSCFHSYTPGYCLWVTFTWISLFDSTYHFNSKIFLYSKLKNCLYRCRCTLNCGYFLTGYTSSNSVFPVILKTLHGIIVRMSVWFQLRYAVLLLCSRTNRREVYAGSVLVVGHDSFCIVYMTACWVVVFLVVHV